MTSPPPRRSAGRRPRAAAPCAAAGGSSRGPTARGSHSCINKRFLLLGISKTALLTRLTLCELRSVELRPKRVESNTFLLDRSGRKLDSIILGDCFCPERQVEFTDCSLPYSKMAKPWHQDSDAKVPRMTAIHSLSSANGNSLPSVSNAANYTESSIEKQETSAVVDSSNLSRNRLTTRPT